MPEQEWKQDSASSAARARVAAYFINCLRYVDAEMLDEAEACLSRGYWRSGVDLVDVPSSVIDATEALCSRATGMMEYGHPDAIAEAVVRILDLWQ